MSNGPNPGSVQAPGGTPSSTSKGIPGGQFALMLLLLVAVLSLMLRGVFLPNHILFSNDGPLGRLMSECHQLPAAFTGTWEDLNGVGYREQGALPNITCALRLWLKPYLFSKFYALAALIILGLSAWCFFRQTGLSPPACILGGLAAVLNSSFFSTACWGVGGHVLALAMVFLALAALVKTSSWRAWLRVVLAGMAVGMALTEGADMGVLFSVCVAAFILYQAWTAQGSRPQNLAVGAGRLGLVMVFAAFLAAYAISALVETQVHGVVGMEQDVETRENRWNWATQWSLPKREALSLAVPGIFGYRLDTPNGGNYWGGIGRDIAWTRYFASDRSGRKPSNGFVRQTGGGIYAGVTVLLVAVWAALQSFRRRDSIYSLLQRRWLWFWLVLAFVSLLLGFGRFAPFYHLVYALPFSSTVRNPVKFMAIVNFAIIVLFAWGVDGLWRKHMLAAKTGAASAWESLKARWNSPGPEKKWLAGCLFILVVSLASWGLYALSRESLSDYLLKVNFSETGSEKIAWFSVRQVGWFILFFFLAAGLVALIISGFFSGSRARWGIVLLGLILTLDLGRANLPWVLYWDYTEKYATNPVVDFFRQKPFEHRVSLSPFKVQGSREFDLLSKLYRIEWAQHPYQYYDIQSSEIVQMSRVPEDMQAFHDALFFDGTLPKIYRLFRRYQLTNTRYLVDLSSSVGVIDQKFDPIQHRFRTVFKFNIVTNGVPSEPGQIDNLTARADPNGEYAVVEFTGALPRAKLYSAWQVNPDDRAVLKQLASPLFDPTNLVLVSEGLPAGINSSTNALPNPGDVEITSYSSRNVQLKANAAAPVVLLLNDKIDPAWHVVVDGKPASMLRCNFLMRGVYLTPGAHTVEFDFQPKAKLLRVSVAAIAISLFLFAVLMVAEFLAPAPAPTPTPSVAPPAPVRSVAPAPAAASAAQVKNPNGGGKKRRNGKSRAR